MADPFYKPPSLKQHSAAGFPTADGTWEEVLGPEYQVAGTHACTHTRSQTDPLRNDRSAQEATTFCKPQLAPLCLQHKGLSLALEPAERPEAAGAPGGLLSPSPPHPSDSACPSARAFRLRCTGGLAP